MKLIYTYLLGLCRAFQPAPGNLAVSNSAYAGARITRFPTTAFTVPNLVAGKGANAGVDIVPCAATGVQPLGFCPDTGAVGEAMAVEMGYGSAVTGVAAAAVTADTAVYTAANGQLSTTGGTGKYLMGRSVTAAATQGDEFILIPCDPVLQA